MNVSPYELRIRRRLGFRTWFGQFDEDIQEVSGHYDDLIAEAKGKGMSDVEAAKYAEQLLGDPKVVAGEIAKNRPKMRGFQLQWFAVILFTFFSISPFFTTMYGYQVGSNWERFVNIWATMSEFMLFLTGGLFALGIVKAKRLSLLAVAAAIAFVPLGYLGYTKIRMKDLAKVDRNAKRHFEGITIRSTVFRKELETYLATIDKATSEPNRTLVESVSNPPKSLTYSCMITPKTSVGTYAYPTKYQVLRDGVIPTIFFERTNSLEEALGKWRSADNLRKVLPAMKVNIDQHFEFLNHFEYENMTLLGQTKSVSSYCLERFVLSVCVAFLSLQLIIRAKKAMRPRRMAR